ncbi:MAG TPA: hypothetical protein VLX91_14610 [Candidatus Acidoferrales bacterium]|nr:hypothetical protein [Candidatus Acidoferrales bacterium]
MLKNLTRVTLVLMLAVLVASCSKSSTSSNNTPPTLTAPTFAGPSSTSPTADTSFGAQTAVSVAGLFNATSASYLGFMTGTSTQNNGTWTWTATNNGTTATWTATAGSSGYDWKLVVSGTWSSNGTNVTVSNWTAISGHESSDGKNGNWTAYFPGTTLVEFTITWTTDAGGNMSGTIVLNDDTGAQQGKYVFTDNKDKSGELVVYTGTVETADIVWLSNGSGHYTEWDDTGTNVIATGTWS